jgi:hypothetical protein
LYTTYFSVYSFVCSANGDIVVTLLPVNTRWPWITPAQFRPELVPEELMAQGLTVHHKFVSYVVCWVIITAVHLSQIVVPHMASCLVTET